MLSLCFSSIEKKKKSKYVRKEMGIFLKKRWKRRRIPNKTDQKRQQNLAHVGSWSSLVWNAKLQWRGVWYKWATFQVCQHHLIDVLFRHALQGHIFVDEKLEVLFSVLLQVFPNSFCSWICVFNFWRYLVTATCKMSWCSRCAAKFLHVVFLWKCSSNARILHKLVNCSMFSIQNLFNI